jgi:CRISPR-associated protein Cas2
MSARRTFVVAYDICEPKRLREVFKIMLGFGSWLQYSLFICQLDSMELVQLKTELTATINHDEDSVVFFDMGLSKNPLGRRFTTLGQFKDLPSSGARIV